MRAPNIRLFVLIIISLGAVVTETGAEDQRNDYPFQCGAAFALMAEVYREAGQSEKSELYNSKFASLATEAEREFRTIGRTTDEAAAYMQKHVDDLASLAEGNAKLVIDFAGKCDRIFP